MKKTTLLKNYLAPLLKWAAEGGNKSEVARLMSAACPGRNVSRQMVGHWLHPEARKRQQPSLSDGLLLAHIIEKITLNK